MNLIFYLKKFIVFRVLWSVLKNAWPVIAIIVFWPWIDSFMAGFPWWVSVKTYAVDEARILWDNAISIGVVSDLVNGVKDGFVNLFGTLRSGGFLH